MPDSPTQALLQVTYQDTLEDLVEVSLLAANIDKPRWSTYLRSLIWVTLPVTYFGYRWWSANYTGVTEVLAVFYVAYVIVLILAYKNYARNVRRAILKQFGAYKNVRLVPPTTVSLFAEYVETASALELQRYAWDIIEKIRREAGYLMLVNGPMTIYVPDRAFDSADQAMQFEQTARELCERARNRSCDLLKQPPGE